MALCVRARACVCVCDEIWESGCVSRVSAVGGPCDDQPVHWCMYGPDRVIWSVGFVPPLTLGVCTTVGSFMPSAVMR
jgi:hypothetical protein